MSRRSQAHAIRSVETVPVGNGTRTITIAVYTPLTRADRQPSWNRNNPTSRAEQKKQRAARRQS